MAVRPTYPSTYVEEIARFVAPADAPTSKLAIIGPAPSGPVGSVQCVESLADFETLYGCGAETTDTVRAGRQFFLQGGSVADVVRIEAGRYAAGLAALGDFNFLILPDAPSMPNNGIRLYTEAAALCADRLAFLLIDHPIAANSVEAIAAWDIQGALGPQLGRSAALCFPRLIDGDGGHLPASGGIAGLMARTDAERGVWKAAAGPEAVLRNVKPSIEVTTGEQEPLNLCGVNVIRSFPGKGTVNWGARTLAGADAEWKYIPVRRTALFIERSLREGLQWTAFEPNDEALWAKVRSSAESFLNRLYRRGAFSGSRPQDCYFVQCDAQTASPAEREQGLIKLMVGFAPVKPAEFLIISLLLETGRANA